MKHPYDRLKPGRKAIPEAKQVKTRYVYLTDEQHEELTATDTLTNRIKTLLKKK